MFTLIGSQAYADDLENSLIELAEKKKMIVADSMKFTANQNDEFWKVYAAYEKDLANIIKDEFELIKKYNSKYNDNSISEQSASNMLAQNFRIQGRALQIKQGYISRFEEVLAKNEVLRFFQIDYKVNAFINAELAKKIPLAGTDIEL